MKSNLSVIAIGGLNTDIVALGAKKILRPGEDTYADRLHIGPGGKSRNIAQMSAILSERRNITMVGKTSKDPILAGTLQFHKQGIEPITREELETNSL